MACAFAGGTERADIEALRAAAGTYKLQLAQRAAIAAKGQQQAGTRAPHTELACEVFCGVTSDKAAHITDIARENIPAHSTQPAYELWLQKTQAQFAL